MEKNNTWEFDNNGEPFREDTLINLRYLNEEVAGQSGFIKLTPDGNGFALGNGEPVRFWAVNTDVYRMPVEDLETHAKYLAKIGVNMVRMHTAMNAKGKGTKLTDVDEEEIDRAWRLVAVMKKQGIYTTISPYWAHNGHLGGYIPEEWGIDGYSGETQGLWGLLFFNKRLQEGYKAWVKELYTRVNPYTGIPLAQEPALAIIQLQNEDSLLFWTVDMIAKPQKALLEEQYGEWLKNKYGSLEKALEVWQGESLAEDRIMEDAAGLYRMWELIQEQKEGKARRVKDQLEFYGRTMYEFNTMMADFYRNELGCKQLINANNWRTAHFARLNDLERWTYTANDIVAVNRYYNGGVHIGENNGWRTDPGHHFTNGSAMLDPRALPMNLKQVEGYPHIISESTWVSPLGYQSEAPFLVAAYQSLSGINTYYWFCATKTIYEDNPYFDFLTLEGGQHPMHKWTLSIPSLLGGFPAAALMFRKGYIKQGETVVLEERGLEELWEGKIPAITEDESYDPNRDEGEEGSKSNIENGIDPLAFLVGPVKVKYEGTPTNSKYLDLTPYIDHGNKIVTSITNEITMDYGTGLCTVNTPKAQGAAGFLNRKNEIVFDNFTIQSNNNYSSVILISMDDNPIGESGKLLLQIGTTARPTDWETKTAEFTSRDENRTYNGEEVVNTGKMPWRIENTSMSIKVKNNILKKAILLDIYGNPQKEIDGMICCGSFNLDVPENAMYMVLTSKE